MREGVSGGGEGGGIETLFLWKGDLEMQSLVLVLLLKLPRGKRCLILGLLF